MSRPTETDCKDQSGHWKHICQLRREGNEEESKDLIQDPRHSCLNCDAVAKYAKNLCNPNPIAKA